MSMVVSLEHTSGDITDHLVDLDASSTVGELVHALCPDGQPIDVLYLGATRLYVEDLVENSGIKDGSIITVGHPGQAFRGARGRPIQVSITGGYGAGHTWPIDVGSSTFGSSPDHDVQVPWFPHHAMTLSVTLGGNISVQPGDEPIEIDGEPVTTTTALLPGAAVTIGPSVVEAKPVVTNSLTTSASADAAGWDIHRPPRLLPEDHEAEFHLPSKPKQPKSRAFPVLMLIAPLVLAVVMVSITKSWHYATFALFSPVMLLGNWLSSKFGDKKTYKQDLAEFHETTKRIQADVADSVRYEQSLRRRMAPDPAELGLIAHGPGIRLWERRSDDPDFLDLRVGVNTLQSGIAVEDPNQDTHKRKTKPSVRDVPVTISLTERAIVGICGHPEYSHSLLAWTAAQTAVAHSPRDVSMYLLTTSVNAPSWEWFRWLPHARPHLGQNTMTTMGVDTESVARRIGELHNIVQERAAFLADNPSNKPPGPAVVVFIDDYRNQRRIPGLTTILREGPAAGVYAVCQDSESRFLPEEAHALANVDGSGIVSVQQQRAADIQGALCDLVPETWLMQLSRRLAPLRDAGEEDGGGLPTSCRLLDLLDMNSVSVQDVLQSWADGGRATRSVIGETADGPMTIDIVRDGPHALVAGTTGSGKSELLQTWVAGLAAVNRPDELCFVLVDYKGGAAFAECANLPHTVGMVTDLDAHLVERSLESLSAELKYREEVFAEVKAANIESYQTLRDADPTLQAMPRLILMIDEFAAMSQEYPEFVAGLVDFAQRGRSLGMHLVLATQRPAGVVTGPIRANTNLRMSLRMTSAAESNDVIENPDAAKILPSTPGRGIAYLGSNTYMSFQTARVAGVTKTGGARLPVWATTWSREVAARPEPRRPKAPEQPEDKVKKSTDLAELVVAINQAHDMLGIGDLRQPWLPPLPERITIDELGCTTGTVAEPGQAIWALMDLPATQQQVPVAIDLATLTHKFVMGAGRTGRTQILRTIAGALAMAHSVADVHMHAIDCGNGGLSALQALPHCGVVAARTNLNMIKQLVDRLGATVAKRGQLLSAAGAADLAELRQKYRINDERRLPHIVVFLDRWEAWMSNFSNVDSGALHERLLTVLADGPSVGVHLVIAGDRNMASGRMMSLSEDKIVLRLNEKNDYSMVGLDTRGIPETMPPGRCLTVDGNHEMHVALLAADDTSTAQAEYLQQLGARLIDRDREVIEELQPFTIHLLPTSMTSADYAKYPKTSGRGAMVPLCGIGGADLAGLGPDLTQNAVFSVTGPAQSGRSTILTNMARGMAQQGARLVILAPRPSPLRDLAGQPGVAHMLTDPTLLDRELAKAVGDEAGTVLMIDDAEMLKDAPAAMWLRDYIKTVRDQEQAVIIGGSASDLSSGLSGWTVEVRRSRRGIMTAFTNLMDGEMLGLRISRSDLVENPTLGRAWYHDGSGKVTAMAYPPCDDA